MVLWFDGARCRFDGHPHSSVTPHPSCPTATCHMSRPHGRPAQIHHEQLESLGGLGRALEPWKVELLKDGISGDALDAVVTDRTVDFPE